jgi:hypothetical protein
MNKLFVSILDIGILRKVIIVLLKKKLFLLFYALLNFQSDLLNKFFFVKN